MIKDEFSKIGVKIEHVYFNTNKNLLDRETNADVIRCFQSSENLSCVSEIESFFSPIIDLSTYEDDIFRGFRKSTRYEILSFSDRNNINAVFTKYPSNSLIDIFSKDFQRFSEVRGLAKIDKAKLLRLSNNTMISNIIFEEKFRVWHVYIFDGQRARLLHSVTLLIDMAEKMSSIRANKWLHWQDILWFRKNGFMKYDLGGIKMDDPNLSGINKFKLGFSKTVEESYNFVFYRTNLGRAASIFNKSYLKAKNILGAK